MFSLSNHDVYRRWLYNYNFFHGGFACYAALLRMQPYPFFYHYPPQLTFIYFLPHSLVYAQIQKYYRRRAPLTAGYLPNEMPRCISVPLSLSLSS